MIRSARTSRKTLTDAVQEQLRQAIFSGTYSPGSQLPTEAKLGQMLGASRTVVREALRILEEDGLIFRRHGVGTFVRKHAILKNLNINYGITEMIQLAGLTPGTTHLAIHSETADEEIASNLNVPIGTPTVTIERVRTADQKPVVYSLDTFAETLLRGADFNPNRLLSESVYQILENEFGHSIDYGVARILPAHAPAPIAKHLDLAPNSLVLYLVQTDYSSLDEPLLYSREYHLPDAFDFMIWRRGPNKLGSLVPSK
ncbi:MAG TPA: GntR family transcriptional regulator [Anaerolineae bacterium]|nr:GntR family transcriptional regulator [Anaerolineae bacterium]